jgi:septum formation protein
MASILLASASQRRYAWLRVLLDDGVSEIESRALISPEPAPSNGLDVGVQTETTCIAKANAAVSEMVISGTSHDLVIVADTLVEDPEDSLIAMGKPDDVVSATAMLLRLSGRRHRVWSSTALLWSPESERKGAEILHGGWSADIWTESAIVEFDDLSEETLSELILSDSWVGKAGAYDLAGKAGASVVLVEGEEVTVLGFAPTAIEALLDTLN